MDKEVGSDDVHGNYKTMASRVYMPLYGVYLCKCFLVYDVHVATTAGLPRLGTAAQGDLWPMRMQAS
jgi:hypothetical protein